MLRQRTMDMPTTPAIPAHVHQRTARRTLKARCSRNVAISRLVEDGASEAEASHIVDAVMDEIPRVRKDMGYIPLVTPTSQIVGAQAVINVLMGGRYKSISDETRDVFAGNYGRTPAPVDPEIQKMVLNGEQPITCRPADLIEDEFDKLKAEIADLSTRDEDVLSYALFPKVWKTYWENRNNPPAAPAAKPAAAAPAPVQQPRAAAHTASSGGGRSMRLALSIGGGEPQIAEVEFL